MASTASALHISELYEKEVDNSTSSRKMKRFRLTHNQSRYLMSEFARQAHPDAAHRERLSREIPGLSPRQVQVWFQNRRAKLKRMSSDDRYYMMKSRALPDEFPILQTLYSYDLTCASKTRTSRSDSSCSSISDSKDHAIASPQESHHATSRFSVSSEACARDCQSEGSSRSCEVSPTSPCTALPQYGFGRRNEVHFRSPQDVYPSHQAPATVGQQPFGSYFEQISTYRTSGYMFPNCPGSECRPSKASAGDIYQTREADAQSLQVFPNWRPTLDTSFRSDMRQESISPQTCSSATSEEYLPESIGSNQFESNSGGSHVFDFNTAPRIVSLPLASESMLNSYDNGQGILERRGHRSKRSLSQPNIDVRS